MSWSYGMSLESIERSYGCVAEYNRCMEEDAEREAEIAYKRSQYYAKNKKILDEHEAAGDLIYFPSEKCVSCPNFVDVGPTDEDDDFPHGYCLKDCPEKWDRTAETMDGEDQAEGGDPSCQ